MLLKDTLTRSLGGYQGTNGIQDLTPPTPLNQWSDFLDQLTENRVSNIPKNGAINKQKTPVKTNEHTMKKAL